jgi:flagellar biosynthesis/type III secretory pathway M-ring protein FliF/YscJ
MWESIKENKISITIVILILILLIWFFWFKKPNTKAKKTNKKSGKKSSKKIEKKEDEDEEDAINKDAEEIFNLVHEGMCNGIRAAEFNELLGNLGDNDLYINLRQIYNNCKNKGGNPEKQITVDDYVKVLDI